VIDLIAASKTIVKIHPSPRRSKENVPSQRRLRTLGLHNEARLLFVDPNMPDQVPNNVRVSGVIAVGAVESGSRAVVAFCLVCDSPHHHTRNIKQRQVRQDNAKREMHTTEIYQHQQTKQGRNIHNPQSTIASTTNHHTSTAHYYTKLTHPLPPVNEKSESLTDPFRLNP
jgi:hypothetical protein